MFAEILVEYGVKSLDKTFTYKVPKNLQEKLKVGMKVTVPFGKNTINGFVLNIKDTYQDNYETKEIIELVDEYLILNEELLELGKYLKEKTLCSLITAYQTMLPSALKIKKQTNNYQKYETYILLNKSDSKITEYIKNNKRSKKQNEILEYLLTNKCGLKKDFQGSSLTKLIDLNLIKLEKRNIYRINKEKDTLKNKVVLNQEQQIAVSTIEKSFNQNNTFLIHGVTGCGKTEVYMTLIEKVINQNKKAILLVPEITLTAQIVKRFYERFGSDVAIFHSALSIGEKYDEYLKILRDEIKIVVGTRSSIFTPIKDLGIIIIDEEHSENYKQDTNPRYNALDMALFRSKYHNIPLVLGSATPSLETMARAKKGVYKLIEIKNRVGSSVLPTVTLIDMQEEMKKGNMFVSELLKTKIKEKLQRNEQIILLLNRRGFSTFITCRNCGFNYKCPHCDITLTYHKTNQTLRCHYCGYTVIKADKCPECREDALNYFGLGTEKLETEIKTLFPESKVVRMDTDTTKNKGAHEKIIQNFQEEKYNILLGTQMISKGLDFPKVSLVGVINADTSLNMPDFRSGEKTFQLLNQVAGRSGRSNLPGEVIIQTFNPDNITLNIVQENDYNKFYNYEMNIRHKLSYPPYYYLIGIKIISKEYEEASREATKVSNYLKKNLAKSIIILGPTTANIFKINNVYRFQLMLKYKKEENIFKVLKELDELYTTNKKVNLEVDVNPTRL